MMKFLRNNSVGLLKSLLVFIVLFSIVLPVVSVQAQEQNDASSVEYTLLAPIPLEEGTSEETRVATAKNYIEGAVRLSIALATGFAVIRVVFGGIKYMSTDAFSGKNEAKGIINEALWGLVLAVGAWLILSTISPDLTKFDLRIDKLPVGGEIGGDLGENLPPDKGEVDDDREAIGCPNCVPILPGTVADKIGTKPPKGLGSGCSSDDVSVCYVHGLLADKLMRLTTALKERPPEYNFHADFSRDPVQWQVTEMFPPTVTHKHACHAYNPNSPVSAMCVDASLKDLPCANSPSCSTESVRYVSNLVKQFTEEANSLGLKVVYEVPNSTRRDALIAALNWQGASNYAVITVPGVSEHFSVYLDQSVYATNK